jgi:transposase
MDAHEDSPRIQVLSVSDTGRRRRWTDDEKVRIVEESHREGVTLTDVARRHEISRSMLYDWRYRHKHGMLGCHGQFMRLVPIAGSPSVETVDGVPPVSPSQSPLMTIDFGERCRVTIPASFDMDAAARLLNGLMVLR